MITPKVSVVVPTFNYGRFLPQSLESIVQQNYQDFEVIVVDIQAGSTDDTRAVIESFQTEHPGRIRYECQDGKGLSNARNTGIRVSEGELIAFLDADDLWMPQKLAMQVGALETHPDAAMVYTDVEYFWDETDELLKKYQSEQISGDEGILRQLLFENIIATPTPLVRRWVFERVGYFDESLVACEDWDMWLRIAAKFEIIRLTVPLARNRIHSMRMSATVDFDRQHRSAHIVLNRAFESMPERLKGLRSHSLARNSYRYGRRWLISGNASRARRLLFESLRLYPWDYKTWALLGLAMISGGSARRILEWYGGRDSLV